MRRRKRTRRGETAARRIGSIRAAIGALDLVCSGTLQRRTKVCGKPGCGCASDVAARHGPYYEWGRMKGGKLVNRMVTREQAALLAAAIRNYRAARRLLRSWEEQSIRIIESETEDK